MASTQFHDRLSALEQENAILRSRLQSCEQSYALLQAEVATYKREDPTRPKYDQHTLKRCLLEATATVANTLLSIEDFDAAVSTALQILGETLETDRLIVAENFASPNSALPNWRLLYEWDSPGTVSQIARSELAQGSWEGIEAWYEQLKQGQNVVCFIEDIPELFRGVLMQLGTKAIHSVPIFVAGQYWGQLGFDDCREVKRRSVLELSVLRIAADCIGSAIQQERTQQSLLQVEQERSAELEHLNIELQQTLSCLRVREQLLETSAIAANSLLTTKELDEAVNAALQTVGIGLDTDRVTIIEFFGHPSTPLPHWRVLYEWGSPGIQPQISRSDLAQGTHEGLEDLYNQLSQGQTIISPLHEVPEPLRIVLAALNVGRLHAIPIFVEGQLWGVIAIDDCRETKQRSLAELSVLKIAANCIGSAIQQQRTQQALLQAEQARSQELERANTALQNTVAALADRRDLEGFIGEVLHTIALEFESPLVEYWTILSADIAEVHTWVHNNRLCSLQQNDEHPSRGGIRLFPELIDFEDFTRRSKMFVLDQPMPAYSVALDQFICPTEWYAERGVSRHFNFPLKVGSVTVGAIGIWLPLDRQITEDCLRLGQALSHQTALAIQLTQLAEEAKQAAIFEERNRMAREIHDTLAQAFTGISLQLEVTKPLIYQDPQTVERILEHISQLAETGLAEARRSVWALYPPAAEYADLAQLLYDSVEHMTRNTEITVEVNVQGDPCPLPPFIGMNLLRIGQEALTNALKHAQAQRISIELTYELDRIWLSIADDGRGFTCPTQLDSLNGGFGLVGMYERCDRIGAQLSICTQPGQGTQILVETVLG